MRRASRVLRNFIAGLLLLIGTALLGGWWGVHRSLPQLDGTMVVPGLSDAVIVDRDHWGRPWIRAKSTPDLLIAQGYVMAQDRLWQMDLLRRASGGELSEIFGPLALSFDKENRTLGLRLAADRAVRNTDPVILALLESYAQGVNRYIEERRDRLPIEFTLLRYQPRSWSPADTYLISLYMWKTLTSTWKSKLNRQWVAEQVGPERARDLFVVDSPLDHYIVGAPSTSPSKRETPADARAPSSTPIRNAGPQDVQNIWDLTLSFLTQLDEESSQIIGSNNFVVSGAHTKSGKPLLANDTHLALTMPGIWYLVHLSAPDWNVDGYALPGAPLVIIGHNDRIAWGFTNSNADVQDLYVETFESEKSTAYRANGKWREADVREETIRVRDARDVVLDVLVTRHGPVVRRDPKNGALAYALRWTALEPGGLDFGFPMFGRASNWNEFIDISRHIAGPAQNTIYADVDGNIGFTIPARIPIRAKGDGVIPLPGDTDEFEWKGYIPFEELPRALNPPEGIIATANARTVGPSYKYFLTDRWAGPFRTARIYELLSGRKDLTPTDCNAVQNDILSLPDKFLAGQLVAASRAKSPTDPRAQRLIEKLSGWDARTTLDSGEASFVEFTRFALFRRMLSPYLGEQVTKYELWEPLSVYGEVWWRDKVFLENVLRERPVSWLPKEFSSYEELLAAAADDAAVRLAKQSSSADAADWNWGRFHPLDMAHPLGRSGLLHRFFSIGPFEQGGTIDTVRAMGIGHGPAMRFVADLSDFDNSLMEIPAGESGQPGSPYYRDEFSEWFAGRPIPAPFSESSKDKSRAHRLLLLPSAPDPQAR